MGQGRVVSGLRGSFARLALPVLAPLNAVPDAVATAISQNSFFVTIGSNTVEFITHYTGDGRCGSG
jgi:hypothetical protein